MRSSLLLASLLAVVPVRLICFVLYPRIHINQFIHSLYPHPLPVMNLLEGAPLSLLQAFLCPVAVILSRDA